MKRIQRIAQTLMVSAIAGILPLVPANAAPANATLLDIVYQPPTGAGEKTRIDGGMRDGNHQKLGLYVIGSEHTGLTTQEQPSLFYFIKDPAKNCKMVLTVLQPLKPMPLVEVALDPSKSGVQRVDLSKTTCKLESGTVYQWVVDVIPDSGKGEVASSAEIKRIEPPATLIDQLQPLGSTLDRAVVYARNGIWYDAFGAISDQIDADAGDRRVRSLCAKLCDQVNLPEVAKYEIQAAGGEKK